MSNRQSLEDIDKIIHICREIREEEDREELWRRFIEDSAEAKDYFWSELEEEDEYYEWPDPLNG